MRYHAAVGLGRTRGAATLPALERVVRDPTQPDLVRRGAAAGIGATGDPRGADVLLDVLGTAPTPLAWEIADGLGQLGDRRAVTPLLARLARERDPTAATHIARALGMLGDARAVPVLEQLAASRLAAAWSFLREAVLEATTRIRAGPG